MSNDEFREAFEEVVPQMLQVAYDYTGGADEVDTIWLYLSNQEGWMNAQAYYRVFDRIVRPNELEEVIADFDDMDGDEVDDLLIPLADLNDQLYESDPDGGDDVPTRVIVRYDVSEEEMNADMHYGPLQDQDVPESDLIDPTTLINNWYERLVATGNESAQP